MREGKINNQKVLPITKPITSSISVKSDTFCLMSHLANLKKKTYITHYISRTSHNKRESPVIPHKDRSFV